MFKRIISVLTVIAMIMSISVGCTNKDDANPKDQAPTNEDQTKEPETKPQDEPKQEESAADKILTWNMGSDPQTFDPCRTYESDGGNLVNNMFDGLMRDIGGGILEPACAESYEISDDLTKYTFHLRENMKWSDGQPLTAKDFEYSWKRVCSPDEASEYGFIMVPYIKGAEAYLQGNGSIDDVAVKAVDDLTLEVELNFPVPYFLNLTSFYTYCPVREDIVTAAGDGWEKNPDTCVTNGPFKLEEYQVGSHLTLVKNDNYWDADSVHLQKIKAFMIQEANTAYNAYEAGEMAILDSTGIPTDMVPELKASDPNFSIQPAVGAYYLLFNVDAEPVNDVRVRKAMAMAVDQRKICEQVLKGGQQPMTGFVPPALKFSDGTSFRKLDEEGNPVEEYGIDPNRAQIEEAQALLAEAGYPNGENLPKIVYVYDSSEKNKKVAEAVQEMLKTNLNIDLELQNTERAVIMDLKKNGDFMLSRGGWGGDYDDPMTMLDMFTSYSGNNDAQWRWNEQPVIAPLDHTLNPKNKEYDDAISQAQRTTGPERDEWMRKAEQILMDEMLFIPVYYNTDIQIVDESVVQDVKKTTMGQWMFKDASMVD